MYKYDTILENNLHIALQFFGCIPSHLKRTYNNSLRVYYKKTKWLLFRAFGSKEGFMHIGLNSRNYYKKDHGYEYFQLKVVDHYIKKTGAKGVLELGCGQGTNLYYLSKWNSNSHFQGIDLYPSKYSRFKKNSNVHILVGDYHDLSHIKTNSIDLVYAIESLCYATNLDKILKEVSRVLKRDGILIVFDAYRKRDDSQYSFIEHVYLQTIEDGFRLKKFPYIVNFEQTVAQNGFKFQKNMNLKKYTRGYLNEIFIRIQHYLHFGVLLKILLKLLPKDVLAGMKAGYLIKDSIKYDLTVYKLHVLSR